MATGKLQKLTHFSGLTLGLFAIWVLLSGKFEVKFLLIGIVAAAAVSSICLPFLMIEHPITGKRYFAFGVNYAKFFLYLLWLIKEIFVAGFDVTREVLKREMDYAPRVIYFSMPFENPVASVVLANSIILTPGTITFDVRDDGVFEVHALNQFAADDLLSGRMPRKVAALFHETCVFEPLPALEVRDIPEEAF